MWFFDCDDFVLIPVTCQRDVLRDVSVRPHTWQRFQTVTRYRRQYEDEGRYCIRLQEKRRWMSFLCIDRTTQMYIRTHTHMSTCMYVCICIYVCMYVWLYVCMSVCLYACVRVCYDEYSNNESLCLLLRCIPLHWYSAILQYNAVIYFIFLSSGSRLSNIG